MLGEPETQFFLTFCAPGISRGLLAFRLLCLATLSQMAATHTFANQVLVWGSPTNAPANPGNIVAISAGYGYTLGITSDGNLADWGTDPGIPPAGLSKLVAVAASHAHSLALKGDGTVAVWGDPGRGWAWANIPDGLTNVVAIAASPMSLPFRQGRDKPLPLLSRSKSPPLPC